MKGGNLKKITTLLMRDYPLVATPLKHESAFQLLVATVLSAQTLDDSVNKVTPNLFCRYPDSTTLAQANIKDVEAILQSINYYKTKAKNIIALAQKINLDFEGIIPDKIEELTRLPGVGRKTANVLISEWFAKPIDKRGNKFGIEVAAPHYSEEVFIDPKFFALGDEKKTIPQGFVVDTHIKRVSLALGLTQQTDPMKIEIDLMDKFCRNEWPEMSLRLLFHGRYRCKARQCLCHLDPEWKILCSRSSGSHTKL
jgi:endonuclease-3